MKKLTKIQNHKIDNSGFRVAWLIPVEALVFGLLFQAYLLWGGWVASILILVPFFMTMIELSRQESKHPSLLLNDRFTELIHPEQYIKPVKKVKKKQSKGHGSLRPFMDVPLKLTSMIY